MAISILLLLLPLTSAIEFTFNHPSSISINESFSISLSATTSDTYDVKIFIQINGKEARISEIYNDGWKNSYYYVISACPEKSEFEIRVKNYSDNATICARLRKTGTTSPTYTNCSTIIINEPESSSNEETPETNEEQDNSTTNIQKQETKEDFIPENNKSQENLQSSQSNTQINSPEKIFLNSKASSSEPFISSDEKLRLIAVYSFTAIAIIIIIFLVMKKP
jgi:hypothetical protein